MFKPKTSKIERIAKSCLKVINQFEFLFLGKVNMYIDYANVRPWSTKLGWHVDEKRLKQFLDSFDNIKVIKFYNGILLGDKDSEKFIKRLEKCKYEVRTKHVKIINLSIDVSSISLQSIELLKKFVRPALLRKYKIETIEYLNKKFLEMNQKGIYFIKDRKCNFDVEISTDIFIDNKYYNIDTFVLWSGDSDFVEPLEQLLNDGKKVVLFATARKVSSELNDLRRKGLIIFDIQKIRNFICWKREIKL